MARMESRLAHAKAVRYAEHFGCKMWTSNMGEGRPDYFGVTATEMRDFLLDFIPDTPKRFEAAVVKAANALDALHDDPKSFKKYVWGGELPVRANLGKMTDKDSGKINRFVECLRYAFLYTKNKHKWGGVTIRRLRLIVMDWAADEAMKKYPKVEPKVTAAPESVTMPIDYSDINPPPDDAASRAELLDAAYGDLGECPIMAADDEIRAQVAALAARVTKLEAERYRDKSDFPKYL